MLVGKRTFVQVRRVVEAPPEAVWDLITDTWRWKEWGPSIVAVRCSERYIKKGSSGQVKTIVGIWLSFVISDYEHGRRWSWHVAGIHATGHRIERVGTEHCRLIFDLPWFALPYALICLLAESRIVRILKKR